MSQNFLITSFILIVQVKFGDDKKIQADIDKFVDSVARDKIQDLKRDVAIWTSALIIVEDGSFVKIREISVSYTLGKSILSSKIPVEEIKFIVSGRNLYTFTNYSGFDPEVALSGSPIYKLDEFSFPNFRTYAATIQITF